MKVHKAVIPAAGWGTRFLPATKAIPKEMLPVVDKPVIQRVVEEAVQAGIDHIIIVTASAKRAIEDHFDRTRDLEATLEKKGNQRLLAEIDRISHLVDISYVRQKEQMGLGHAVLTAKPVVGNEPFAVLLPDDLIDADQPAIGQLMAVYDDHHASVIAVQPVSREEIPGYGVIRPKSLTRRVYEILDLVEKPTADEAPSNLAIVGRYVLTPEIFEALERTAPGRGGEIQLTDGLRFLLRHQKLLACEFRGTRFDVGMPIGLIKASIDFALRDPALRLELEAYMVGSLAAIEETRPHPEQLPSFGEIADEPTLDLPF